MRAALLCLAILVSATACGSSDESAGSPATRDQNVMSGPNTGRLIEQLKQAVGVELVVRDVIDNPLLGTMTTINLPEAGPGRESIKAKYGEFSIGVFADLDPRLRELLAQGAMPDDNGVYWEEQFPEDGDTREEPYWTARKFYGDVQLLWWSNERRADGRWQALDAILRKLLA
jgi:hypothetical protein